MAQTGCTTRITTTKPDGSREDQPLDDVLEDSDKIPELENMEGLVSADFNGDDFSTPSGESFSLKANFQDSPTTPPKTIDPESLQPDSLVYNETSRVVEQVVVTSDDGASSVTIDRMVSVTFETESGKSMQLNFDNPTP